MRPRRQAARVSRRTQTIVQKRPVGGPGAASRRPASRGSRPVSAAAPPRCGSCSAPGRSRRPPRRPCRTRRRSPRTSVLADGEEVVEVPADVDPLARGAIARGDLDPRQLGQHRRQQGGLQRAARSSSACRYSRALSTADRRARRELLGDDARGRRSACPTRRSTSVIAPSVRPRRVMRHRSSPRRIPTRGSGRRCASSCAAAASIASSTSGCSSARPERTTAAAPELDSGSPAIARAQLLGERDPRPGPRARRRRAGCRRARRAGRPCTSRRARAPRARRRARSVSS